LNPNPIRIRNPAPKVLKHTATGKVRLLMRRDQVLKICVNHYVTPALVAGFKEKDSKSWTWAAQDYSDGELTGMTFALRLVLVNLFKSTCKASFSLCFILAFSLLFILSLHYFSYKNPVLQIRIWDPGSGAFS
jgi:hypothetical protein